MSSNSKKQPALGRGLGALLQSSETDITSVNGATAGSIAMLPISSIEANPFNPRVHFEKEALDELCKSIQIHGIVQPLTVRKLGRDKYQIISGERRFRAAQLAGLQEVPAYIRIANDQTMLEMALVENIQRENLNAIEVALSYERLLEECNLTQEQLSEKVAKSRSNIANHIRLLKLPTEIQVGVRDNLISMGHARALLALSSPEEQITRFNQIIEENLSVRAIESLVKNEPVVTKTPVTKASFLNSNQKVFKEFLSDRLSAKVSIQKTGTGTGKLSVYFNSESDLNRIIELLKR
ncbi:MAG: ParB/RepB/Spo0J family partition protein [Bacteroidetes bacterium]|nr:ParB/RepB/Spo0J family partition protein [Bacteroidota bacterium]